MCNTLNIKALELYCNIKKWNIELDTLINYSHISDFLEVFINFIVPPSKMLVM